MQGVSGKRLFFVTTILMILGFFSVGLSSTGHYVQQIRDQDLTCTQLKTLHSYYGRMYHGEMVTTQRIQDMQDLLYQQGIVCNFPNQDSCSSVGEHYCDRSGSVVNCVEDDFGILVAMKEQKPHKFSECLDGEWVQPFMG